MKKNNRRKVNVSKLEHWQIVALCLMMCDLLTVHLSYFLALWIRFDCIYSAIPEYYLKPYIHFITPYAIVAIALFWILRMYRSMWRYASYGELIKIFEGSVIASLAHTFLITIIYGRMPLSYYLWGSIFQLILLLAPRFSYRLLLFIRTGFYHVDETAGRVMIVGADQSGQMILRDMRSAKELNDKPICFIDDNPNKWGRFIEGVPIVGGRDDRP